jgi:hypothetical protein
LVLPSYHEGSGSCFGCVVEADTSRLGASRLAVA